MTATAALHKSERTAIAAVAGLVAVLGALGMVNSFARVSDAVAPSFGGLAWTVPLGIDIGIAAFTLLDLVLVRMGMRLGWLRVFPWALVAVTVYLNVAGEHTAIGMVAHAVLPGLWVVAVEAGTHALRAHVGIRSDRIVLDRVRVSRWLLAPLATVRLWRRMVLWETRSYPDALVRERARLLARCDLADRYGPVVWRWTAPRRQRVLYRLGELAPASTEAGADTSAPVNSGRARPKPVLVARADGDLESVARRVAANLSAQGIGLSRRSLVEGMRRAGRPVGNARAGELLAGLRRNGSTAGVR
jgi:hypothetical protein